MQVNLIVDPNAFMQGHEHDEESDEEDDDAWDALDELEGTVGVKKPIKVAKRKKWLPEGLEPVLEEQPKWCLLADVLQEIEEEIIRRQGTLPSCQCIFFFKHIYR